MGRKVTTYPVVLTAKKSVATSKTSNSTLASDPDLIITGLTANFHYHIRGHLNVSYGSASTTNGIRLALDFNLVGSVLSCLMIITNGSSSATTESKATGITSSPAVFMPTVASVTQVCVIDAVVRLDYGSSLFLSWAQGVSDAVATTINSGSLTATRLP